MRIDKANTLKIPSDLHTHLFLVVYISFVELKRTHTKKMFHWTFTSVFHPDFQTVLKDLERKKNPLREFENPDSDFESIKYFR